jgi:hypothetical protein
MDMLDRDIRNQNLRMLSSITNVTGGPQWDETQGTTQTTTQTHS